MKVEYDAVKGKACSRREVQLPGNVRSGSPIGQNGGRSKMKQRPDPAVKENAAN